MNGAPAVGSAATELRAAFDHSFALPPRPASEEVVDLLTIRLAGHPYAVRLHDIAGIMAARAVVPVPTAGADLLGLAGVRGSVVPVFGLASILGHEPATGSPRWMLMCGGEEPIALAFSDFEGYRRLPASSLYADDNPRATRQYVNQLASIDGAVRAVINISLVVATIRNRIGRQRPALEQ